MINKKSRDEIKRMRHAGHIVALVHKKMKEVVEPGISTKELDSIAMKIIKENKAIPTFLGYSGFPACICTSINEKVVHGIPSEKQILQDGDIVSVDSVVSLKGYCSDSAYTFPVGDVAPETLQLMRTTKEALYLGIGQAVTGHRLGDIGATIQEHCEHAGYSVVREFVGHGIGREMHEEPEVCNYGHRGNGIVLKSGMTLAIEPMICLGRRNIIIEEDGWTARTADRKPAAHYELSVCVRNGKADILSTFDYIKEVLGDRFI